MKNRSRMDIYFDILSAARQPVRKTHIMYRSNLSYKQLDAFLDSLIDRGLIEEQEQDDSRTYRVTDRGLNFIELFENISTCLAPDERNGESDMESGFSSIEIIQKQSFVY